MYRAPTTSLSGARSAPCRAGAEVRGGCAEDTSGTAFVAALYRHASLFPLWLAAVGLAALAIGCGPDYQARVGEIRSAIDRGSMNSAISAANRALGVDNVDQLPADDSSLTPLLLLERGALLHAAGDHRRSARDLGLADNSLEILDLSDSTAKDIAKYMFSDAQGNYRTPPYEKLMLNTLNQINYLAMGDLEGARVEARRIGVLERYFEDDARSTLALGAYVSGFTFEHSGRPDEAILWYLTALDAAPSESAERAVARLASYARESDARVQEIAARYPDESRDTEMGDVLVIYEAGRSPYWVAQRLPVGAAVALVGARMSHADREAANQMVLSGLFTWVNFPEMVAPDSFGPSALRTLRVDGVGALGRERLLDLENDALTYYDQIRGDLVLASLTRLVTRFVAGQVTEGAISQGSGSNADVAGFILGRVVEGAMTVADMPDTRSWNSLPRQYEIARKQVSAGSHELRVDTPRGTETRTVDVAPGGFAVVVVHAF